MNLAQSMTTEIVAGVTITLIRTIREGETHLHQSDALKTIMFFSLEVMREIHNRFRLIRLLAIKVRLTLCLLE